MYIKVIALAAIATLTACGSGSGTPSGATTSKEVTHNVVLSTNGSSLTATYDTSAAKYVADGDSTTSNFWAGNISSDNVVIDFGQVAKLSDVTIYTNNVSYNSSNPAIKVELSEDKQDWRTTMNPYGVSDIGCPTFSAGNGKLSCTFESEEKAQYMRITTNSGSVYIYEVESTGTVKVSES